MCIDYFFTCIVVHFTFYLSSLRVFLLLTFLADSFSSCLAREFSSILLLSNSCLKFSFSFFGKFAEHFHKPCDEDFTLLKMRIQNVLDEFDF